MPLIAPETVRAYVEAGRTAETTAAQGRSLEDLICYVLGQVPGVAVTHRNELNAFDMEEIDVAIWNDTAKDGFFFLSNLILVECKNWSKRVGSEELNWFDTKLRNRGLTFGILVTTLGITGQPADMTAAHNVVAGALREGRRLIVLTTDELETIGNSDNLVRLIKVKLCDLAVKGTIG